MRQVEAKEKVKAREERDEGKVFSSLDAFWTKYIRVTNWHNDEEVREALRNEEAARQRFDTSDG